MGLFHLHDERHFEIVFLAERVSSIRHPAGHERVSPRPIGAIVRADGMDFPVIESETIAQGLWQGALTWPQNCSLT